MDTSVGVEMRALSAWFINIQIKFVIVGRRVTKVERGEVLQKKKKKARVMVTIGRWGAK